MSVVGQAGSVAETRARIPEARADVAVLDVRLPDGSGVDLCRELKARMPRLRCLMLSSFADLSAFHEAMRAGASGYLVKNVRGDDLVAAVRAVGRGEVLPGRMMGRPRRPAPAGHSVPAPETLLTPQERVLLELIGEGLTNRQIAERMYLAEKTVKNYVSRLLAKLGMHRRTQAAVLATELRARKSGR